ncbi:S-layer homology domain-containing protein [Salibacterium salarium]|uniref:S-layer homology domain-containing protein n=1 Tax=Salibacterium salarium TaxID=284579 RepID=A0A428N9Y3_9BACI|nr:S-layer homology domain-containing protein [Salibacterium salarium]RSL35161.1 S-layer homology domain-containing protein [Salibacterium salarium]
MSDKKLEFYVTSHWKIVAAIISVFFFLYISSIAEADAADFTDVDDDYWASEEIAWANQEGIITGYEDGTFDPGNEMTEAQFVTMITRYFNMETSERRENQHWSQPAYIALSDNNLRMPGLRENSVKNRSVTRAVIGRALAHSQAQEAGLEQSVAWMFEEGLTTGRQEGETQTERYDVNGKLTRAQAAVFFKRLHDNGLSVWKASTLLDMTSEGSNEYTEAVRSLYEEAGVTLYAQDNNSFATANQEYYHLFQAYQGERREFVIARTSKDNFELAADAAHNLGAPHSSGEILDALITADETGEEQVLGTTEVTPRLSDIFILWDEQE